MATADSHMVVTFPAVDVTQMSDIGEMVTEMVSIADETSSKHMTTTLAFITLEFKNSHIMMHLHQNTVDRQITGSRSTRLELISSKFS